MREPNSLSVTLLIDLAELKLIRSQLPALLLLASQRVNTLPSLAMAAVRLLPDWLDALAVPLNARLTPPPPDELEEEELDEEELELLDEEELLEELLPPEELLDDELEEELLEEELLDEPPPPHPPITSADSFRPLPAPADAIAMHLTFSAGSTV